MGRRLYVGNLPYSATEDQLSEMFSRAGKVDSVRVMRDMATGRARGFAFVEMSSDEEAQKAISEFHEQQMEGRALVVNEARPKPEGGFGGGGGRGGGGGYRGGGSGGGGGNRSFDDGDFSGGRGEEPPREIDASDNFCFKGRRIKRRPFLFSLSPEPYSSTTQPSRRLTTRLPYAALASECVTCTIVVPLSFSFLNSSMISLPWLECRLPVGSSARITLGLEMTARATATSCCCPPESWFGYKSFFPTMANLSRMSHTMLSRSDFLMSR